MHRPKVKVHRSGKTSPLMPSSQTLSIFGYDLGDLGDSESVGDTAPYPRKIEDRGRIGGSDLRNFHGG